ncbi:unnamed protein product [Paramecium primaurelia]|uniref:Protein kinase domain-containing protein n=2 Tax=Paramecium TaxID=5884 RepID=A0A8S1VRQ1_9CILI|nr:unnamed protein product [Paramecium primaurelia]CAD8180628.1 unnamed protein product [Paramecium pentaurelia]
MKQTKKRLSYIKNQKPANIEWILNLLDQIPKYQLQQSNLKSATQIQLQGLQDCDQILKSELYSFNTKTNKFQQITFSLYPNMLINNYGEFLILSTCIMIKKIIQYKEFIAQGVLLYNHHGNLFIFYESYVQQLNWEKQLKRFCKQQNFSQKYTIKEKLSIPNHFVCVKNKNNRIYTVQMIRFTHLNEQNYEQLMNEINILMCFKQSGLNQFHALFEDGEILYILYDYWIGDTLFKQLQQGLLLTTQQISQIIYQLIKVCRFLTINNLYHAAILPTNIILLRNNNNAQQQTKITLFNFSFRDGNQVPSIIQKLPNAWIPPEFQCLNVKQDLAQIDLYQIGVLLYYLTIFLPEKGIKQGPFNKTIDNFQIQYAWLKGLQNKNPIPYSYSLIDFLCQLLDPNPQTRITYSVAICHQWLINQKHQQNPIEKENIKILASLRTILELREQNSNDYASSQRFDQKLEQHITSSSEEEDQEQTVDNNLHRISKERNCIPHYINLINIITPCKHPSRKSVNDQIHFV